MWRVLPTLPSTVPRTVFNFIPPAFPFYGSLKILKELSETSTSVLLIKDGIESESRIMQQKISYGLVFALMVLMAGCASPSSSVLIGDARPEISAEQVKVYLEKPANYEEIALIEATSDSSWSFGEQAKMDAVLKRLKQEAAKVGANGILLQKTGEKEGNSVYVGTGAGKYSGNLGLGVSVGKAFGLTDKTGEGIAIYVKPEDEKAVESDKND